MTIRSGRHTVIPAIMKTRVRAPASAAAVIPWYLAGGAPAPVAAYQAKATASYAASKVNLANPGTYDLTDGTSGYPAWATGTGWTFTGSAWNQYLNTGITTRLYNWTMICQYSGATYYSPFGEPNVMMGKYQYRMAMYLAPTLISDAYARWQSGGNNYNDTSGGYGSGNMALAGQRAFFNGTFKSAITADWNNIAQNGRVLIGAYASDGTPAFYFNGIVIAAALYDSVLSDEQVAAVATAMALL